MRVLILDLLSTCSRPSSTDDSSRLQEVPVGFVEDATPTLKAGWRLYPVGVGPHGPSADEYSRADDSVRAAKMGMIARHKISSVAGGLTRLASTLPSFSSSEYSEFYTEPDLQMTRANWWQGLVAIYHPNAEIGNRLVMADIVH